MSVALVVVDTNIVVAGLLTATSTAPTVRILDAMLDGRLRFVLSIALLAEYRIVLLRRKIAVRHRLSPGEVDELLTALAERGAVRETGDAPPALKLPRGDEHLGRLLEAAPRARLVSGDPALVRVLGSRATTPSEIASELEL